MKCLKCGHAWKRTNWKEYVTGLSKCPECGSRKILRY